MRYYIFNSTVLFSVGKKEEMKDTKQRAQNTYLSLLSLAAGGAVAAYIVSICNGLMNSVREGRAEHFLVAKVISLQTVMLLAGIALAVAALAALAASRCFDRRWRSVYALALAMLAMLVKLAVILNMLSDPDALWPAVAQELWPVALVGLAGTGLSLL